MIKALQQAEAPEAHMTLAADHQMVVDGDARRLGRGLDPAHHLAVVARRLGIARGMIVHGQLGAADRVTIKAPRDRPESGSTVLMLISRSLKFTQAGGYLYRATSSMRNESLVGS